MNEKEIERHLRDKVRHAGGRAYKFESPGHLGVPDRIVIMPGGKICFVEVKAPGKKPRQAQVMQMAILTKLGCRVAVVDNEQRVDELLGELML